MIFIICSVLYLGDILDVLLIGKYLWVLEGFVYFRGLAPLAANLVSSWFEQSDFWQVETDFKYNLYV